MALCARPGAVKKFNTVPLLIEVPVPVARKVSCPIRDGKRTCHILTWIFGAANVCLVITNTEMLRPELRTCGQTHAGLMSEVDHPLIESFCMHIDLDRTSRATKRFEESLPEAVISF